MENNHKLGLYVSYYLARFDKAAYGNLGYGNKLETHKKIGELLSVNSNTVQNWRDEFDPLFEHRAGWYQRPMSPSRVSVVQALEDLNEPQIREIVLDILSGRIQDNEEELEQLLKVVTTDDRKKRNSKFILRGPTGKAAEELFIKYFSDNKKPTDGKLVDCRDLGVGYDFRIEGDAKNCFVEVKGLSENIGGILFTNKEWTIAKVEGDNYFLCVISNLNEQPNVVFIQNPAERLNPQKNIYTSIQISWSVNQNQLIEKK